MKPYLVDTPDGKTITIEGPDDATDDELIAIAQKSFKSNAKPVGKAKPPVDTRGDNLSLPVDRTSRELPDLGTSEDLIKEMKAGDSSLQNAAPAAFKEIEKAGSAPPARGSINQKIAEGDLEGAWNSLTDLEKGSLAASVPVLAYGGYKIADKFLGGEKAEKPSVRVEPTGGLPDGGGGSPPNNIKSRTFEAGNYGSQTIDTAPKGMSAKEIQVATDIKDRFGYDINDLKNQFGVSDIPITDINQAEILATTARNKELAAAETPKTPVVETPPAAPVEEIKPAPVAETPKAPVPPPEAASKAAVVPETIESKLGKPTLVTGSGMPAYQGQSEKAKPKHKGGNIASLADVPKNMVFVPGGNYMDSVRNAVGQEAYTANLRSTGGYPASNEAAAAQSRQINASLNRPTREEAIAQGLPPKENTKSITQYVGGKKLVKVAGATGALVLFSDLANAAVTGESAVGNTASEFKNAMKSGDYGLAASNASELLNLSPFGMVANALFGNSPEELKTLREAEQRKKVGAGRGIAPPSAYRR